MNDIPFIQQGWQCPVCKRVYSPSTSMCRYCGNEEATIINTVNHLVMKNFSCEESEEYNKVLDKLCEPTGFNVLGLEKNNPCIRCDEMTDECMDSPCEKWKNWIKGGVSE